MTSSGFDWIFQNYSLIGSLEIEFVVKMGQRHIHGNIENGFHMRTEVSLQTYMAQAELYY